ncbi:MAG TPA: hypothetical protein VGW37_10115, partial [Terriglobia bacterium]|nr:hypothetical protein [Terriglobia bacterium]
GISALLRELHPQPMEQIFSSIAAIAQLSKPCKRLTLTLAQSMPDAAAIFLRDVNSASRGDGPRLMPKLSAWGTKQFFPMDGSVEHLYA